MKNIKAKITKKLNKNLFKIFLFLFIFILAVPVFSQNRVVDNAGLLSQNEIQRLTNLISSIASEHNFDLVIVIENSIGDTTPQTEERLVQAYADDYFDYNGYGYGENHDGCLLLHVLDVRQIYQSTSGRGIPLLSHSAENRIYDTIIQHLRSENYFTAYNSFLTNWNQILINASQPRINAVQRYHVVFLIVAWLIAFLISLIVVSSMKSKMNNVLAKTQAAGYIVQDSLKFSVKNDQFLYSTVAKVPRASSSSSQGGGGKGVATRVSSSGRSHGGGGRKY
ncbi:MAG: TPM domain-containing protein [Treponema sp.]|nr:TPM domain-containing protein [Treponema sp.]